MFKKLKKIKRNRRFKKQFEEYKRLDTQQRFAMDWNERFPCLDDATSNTYFDTHYIYHPAWAARILKKTMPEYHVDISSSLHFVTLVSAFVPVKFYDFRPPKLYLDNLTTDFIDINKLCFEDESVSSISCMHVVEHIGLGRYGDALDPEGDMKAIAELKRVLAKGGSLMFVVPVGRPRIMYNAHRIYSYGQILEYFSDLHLEEFSLVPDDAFEKGIINNATKEDADVQSYGCGCFWFKKP